MDKDPLRGALKRHSSHKKEIAMQHAYEFDDGLWTKHTQWHWSRLVNGQRLDYWPSKRKYRLGEGPVIVGDVQDVLSPPIDDVNNHEQDLCSALEGMLDCEVIAEFEDNIQISIDKDVYYSAIQTLSQYHAEKFPSGEE